MLLLFLRFLLYYNSLNQLGRLVLAEAKGLRHLAVLSAIAGEGDQDDFNSKASAVLDSHPDQDSLLVKRDRMQLLHSDAEILAVRFGVLTEGTIRKNDHSVITQIEQALSDLENATLTFQAIGDLERCAKSTNLQARLLSAIHRELEADEVRAKLERLLAASQLLSLDRILPIPGSSRRRGLIRRESNS